MIYWSAAMLSALALTSVGRADYDPQAQDFGDRPVGFASGRPLAEATRR
jgi:hypothetical protein